MENGKAGKLTRSLWFKLAMGLSILVALFGAAVGYITFHKMEAKLDRLWDSELLQATYGRSFGEYSTAPVSSKHKDRDVLFLPFPVSAAHDSGLGGIEAAIADGFHTIKATDAEWRVLIVTRNSGERHIAAHKAGARSAFAGRRALEFAMPYFFLVLCIVVATLLLIQHFLKPIQTLAASLDTRPENDLAPLQDYGAPSEIWSFVSAINRLLEKVSRSAETQRRFVADAAHELRLPLTAIAMQAEGLRHLSLPDEAIDRLDAMTKGVRRSQALVNQLLGMARARERQYGPPVRLVVSDCLRETLENLLPEAEAKNIDLGLAEGEDLAVTAPKMALRSLLQNLLENAVRYTPENGAIDVHVRRKDEWVYVAVADSGPGIPEEERERVFDPFYRISENDGMGSGLGLAIAKAIAEGLGGAITLEYTDSVNKKGLLATFSLPAA